ncbi:MAG: copper resistance protein CopC [Chloroflexi bacterium]|nr:copper resistance protein CopC [Chloroflexota bacterium]
MKRYMLYVMFLLGILLVACAPAATPTPDAAMMKKETATAAEAMMKKETATAAEAMMKKETSTAAEAMMKKETATAAEAMMKKETSTAAEAMKKETPGAAMMKVPEQVFAAHFVESSPKHEEALGKVPEKLVIKFNFTLTDISTITLLKDDKPIDSVKAIFASDKLSMTANLPTSAGDGLYVVKYKACWPDKSCHDGLFAFKIDSKMVK